MGQGSVGDIEYFITQIPTPSAVDLELLVGSAPPAGPELLDFGFFFGLFVLCIFFLSEITIHFPVSISVKIIHSCVLISQAVHLYIQ